MISLCITCPLYHKHPHVLNKSRYLAIFHKSDLQTAVFCKKIGFDKKINHFIITIKDYFVQYIAQ